MAQSDTDTDIGDARPERLSADCGSVPHPKHSAVQSALLRHGTRCWTSTPGCWDLQEAIDRSLPVSGELTVSPIAMNV